MEKQDQSPPGLKSLRSDLWDAWMTVIDRDVEKRAKEKAQEWHQTMAQVVTDLTNQNAEKAKQLQVLFPLTYLMRGLTEQARMPMDEHTINQMLSLMLLGCLDRLQTTFPGFDLCEHAKQFLDTRGWLEQGNQWKSPHSGGMYDTLAAYADQRLKEFADIATATKLFDPLLSATTEEIENRYKEQPDGESGE